MQISAQLTHHSNPILWNGLRMLVPKACLFKFATASCISSQSSCIQVQTVVIPGRLLLYEHFVRISSAFHACQPNLCSQRHLHLSTPPAFMHGVSVCTESLSMQISVVFLVQSVHRGIEGSRSCPSRAFQCAQRSMEHTHEGEVWIGHQPVLI